MRFPFMIIAGLAVLTLAAPAFTLAAGQSLGEREYQSRCAMCHGVAGKGDGWLSGYLTHRTPSLTQLRKNNGGVFPFESLTQVIDGRAFVKLHGPREMPVWRTIYSVELERAYESQFGLPYSDEGIIRARILALIEYISQFQE